MAQKNGNKVSESEFKTKLDELAYLAKRKKLMPEAVVEFARDPKTHLHSAFQWDDTKAAHKYRIWQARQQISFYIIVFESPSGPINVRLFHSLPSDRINSGGYRKLGDLLKDKEMTRELVHSALKELNRVKERYQAIAALVPVWKAVDRVARAYPHRQKHTQQRNTRKAA